MYKGIILSIIFFIIAVTGALTYLYGYFIPHKIEQNAHNAFAELGFDKVRLDGIEKNLGKVKFSNIEFDEKDFTTLKSLTAEFSLSRFFLDPQNAFIITLDGLKMTGEISSQLTPSIAGIKEISPLIVSLHHLPIYKINIKDARIDLLTEEFGGLTIKYDSDFTLTSDQKIKLAAFFKTNQKRLNLAAGLTGEIGVDGRTELNIKADQISARHQDIRYNRGHANLTYNYDPQKAENKTKLSGEINFTSVRSGRLPLKDVKSQMSFDSNQLSIQSEGTTFGPKSIKWTLQIDNNNLESRSDLSVMPMQISDYASYLYEVGLLTNIPTFPNVIKKTELGALTLSRTKIYNQKTDEIRLSAVTQKHAIPINAQIDIENKNSFNGKFSTTAKIISLGSSPPPRETNDGQEDKSAPLKFLTSLTGTFKANRKSKDTPYTLQWSAKSEIKDGQLDFKAFKLNDLSANIRKSQTEFETDTPNTDEQKINFLLPLKPEIKHLGHILVDLQNSGLDSFGPLEIKIFNGEISTLNPALRQGNPAMENTLQILNINLSEYIKHADLPQTTINGQMGGIVPYKIIEKSDGIHIDVAGGLLQSQSTGTAKLSPELIKALFPEENEESLLIRQVLKNYHYDFFEIRLDGNLLGRMMMTLSSRGFNPDLKNKKPIDINIQIETQPHQLLKRLLYQ